MQLVVTQDKLQTCCVWKSDVVFFKNKLGIIIARRPGKLLGRITKEFCKKLFGCVPRPNTAMRIEMLNLGKEEIEKQE